MMEELAKEEFDATIQELKKQDGITEEDVEQFKKTAIIQRSIDIARKCGSFTDVHRQET